MAFEFRAGIFDLEANTVLGNFIDDAGCGHCQKAFKSGDLRLSAGILVRYTRMKFQDDFIIFNLMTFICTPDRYERTIRNLVSL